MGPKLDERILRTTKATTQQKLDKQQAEKRMQLQSLFAEKSACRFAYMNTNEYLSTACVASSAATTEEVLQCCTMKDRSTLFQSRTAEQMPSPNVKNSEVPIIVIVFVNQTNDGFSIIPSMFGEHEDDDGQREENDERETQF